VSLKLSGAPAFLNTMKQVRDIRENNAKPGLNGSYEPVLVVAGGLYEPGLGCGL